MVFISGIQQSESVIHINTYIHSFSHIGYYKLLIDVSVLYDRFSVLIYLTQ